MSLPFRAGYANRAAEGRVDAPAASLESVARWTGTWLTGLESAGVRPRTVAGQRLGLPPEGRGSVAPFGTRAVAFVVDLMLAGLLAGLTAGLVNGVADVTPLQRTIANYGAFGLVTALGLVLAGQTPGMRLTGLRVLSLKDSRPVIAPVPALLRTVVLATFVLAVVLDRDGRGLHDRVASTVVVRA